MCGFGDGWGLGCSLWGCGRFSSISAVFREGSMPLYCQEVRLVCWQAISAERTHHLHTMKRAALRVERSIVQDSDELHSYAAYGLYDSIVNHVIIIVWFFLFLFWRYMQPMSTIFYTLMPNTKWYMPHFESIYPCIFIWSSWDYQTNTNHFSNLVKRRFEIQWLFLEPEVYIIIYRR